MIISVINFFGYHFFEIISTAILGYLAFLTLQFTAKPRIRIFYEGDSYTNKLRLSNKSSACLNFRIKNVGHWHSKPAATNICLYLNFDPKFDLISAKYGSILENEQKKVRIGKNHKKYFKVEGIILSINSEEYVQVELISPKDHGNYKINIAAFSDEGDLGVHIFDCTVE